MKTVNTAAAGIVLGVTAAFLTMIMTVVVAALSERPASVPFVFSATVSEENGLPAVEFVPNGFGLLAVIGVVAVAYVCLRVRAHKHR